MLWRYPAERAVVEDPGGEQRAEHSEDVEAAQPAGVAGELPHRLPDQPGEPEHPGGELGDVRPVEGELGGRPQVAVLPGESHRHRRRAHPVGEERADDRARAGADVDVEVVDGEVDEEVVEGAERPDLVGEAGDPTPTEHECAPTAGGIGSTLAVGLRAGG